MRFEGHIIHQILDVLVPRPNVLLTTTMRSIQEVISTPWRGSEKTYEMVREQIRERWGDQVAEEFDPGSDAAPLTTWASYGYRIKAGSKALKSVTYVEVKNDKGEVEKKIRRVINIFHRKQVQKMS